PGWRGGEASGRRGGGASGGGRASFARGLRAHARRRAEGCCDGPADARAPPRGRRGAASPPRHSRRPGAASARVRRACPAAPLLAGRAAAQDGGTAAPGARAPRRRPGPRVEARLAAGVFLVTAALLPGRADALMAGASSLSVDLPAGVPLAGYGSTPRRAWIPDVAGRLPYAFWFNPSTGVHDPFRLRALVLESDSVRVLWL